MIPAATVDILVVSYNTRALLEDCLTSLDAHPPPETIKRTVSVFDNASQDGSADLVQAEFPAVRLIRSARNVGFARANRILADSSSSEYLMLLNSDTRVTCDAVTPLLASLEEDPAIAIVGPRLMYPDGTLQASSENFPSLRFEVARLLYGTKAQGLLRPLFDIEGIIAEVRQVALAADDRARDTEFLWATCWMMRTGDAIALDLFGDDRFVTYDEDLDFCRRLRAARRRIVYLPSVTVVHVGGSSSTSERKRELSRAGRVAYYRRHHGRLAAGAFLALSWAERRLKHQAVRSGRRPV